MNTAKNVSELRRDLQAIESHIADLTRRLRAENVGPADG